MAAQKIQHIIDGASDDDGHDIAVLEMRLHRDTPYLSTGDRWPLADIGVPRRPAVGQCRHRNHAQSGRIEIHQHAIVTRTDLHHEGIAAHHLAGEAGSMGQQGGGRILAGDEAAQMLRLDHHFLAVDPEQLNIKIVVQIAADEIEGQQRDQGECAGQRGRQG